MNKSRYILQWEAQPTHFCRTMCSLLESQILVDMTIISNTYSIQVHKCVMAANSPYFREQLHKEPSIDKVVMNGIKQTTIKALIEFIYCGETTILEENIQELVAVANYFEVRGIKAILPQKLNMMNNDSKGLIQIKPPIFFCKNEKVRPVRHNSYVNDYVYGAEDVKVVLDNSYPIYDSSRRRTQGKTVADEACVALAKEEAASRFALQMLQKDINMASNLFVIEDTCTEATVQTSLTSQFDEESNMMQTQDSNLIQNDISETQTSIASITDPYKLQEIDNKIEKDDKMMLDSNNKNEKCSDKLKECFQILQNEISTEYPIIYKDGDGSYMNVTTEMIKNLAQSGAIHYQVVHDDGNLSDYHQYICNSYSDIHVNDTHEEINKECEMPKRSEPISLKQLVDETIMPDYQTTEKSYLENINQNITAIISSVPSLTTERSMVEDIPEPSHEEVVSDLSFNTYIMNEKDSINFVSQSNKNISKSLDVICDNLDGSPINENVILNNDISEKNSEMPLKRKRGRPRKHGKESILKIKEKDLLVFDDNHHNISANYTEEKTELLSGFEETKQNDTSCSITSNVNQVNKDLIIVDEIVKEEIDNSSEENKNQSDISKNDMILNLVSLNKEIYNEKNIKSPKTKRRCSRLTNKENLENLLK